MREAKRLIRANPQQGWIDLARTYGKNFRYQGSLATCDPAVVQTMLMQRVHTQHRSEAYKFMSRLIPGAPGVLFMDGEQWHKHVQAVMPMFTKATVDAYTQVIHETIVANTARWQDGQCLDDLYQCITGLGLQVVLRVGYGLDPADDFAFRFGQELMAYKLQTMTSQARLDEFGFSLAQVRIIPAFMRERTRLQERMRRLNNLVQRILEDRESRNYRGQDWITLLHQTGLPLPQITDELNHIYGAFNAIDYAITCGLVELSQHPEWAERIRTEAQQVLGSRAYPTREDFASLPNTINFMKEVFRHYPVAIAVIRRTGEALSVADDTWPEQKEVMILIQSLHHHPDFWDEPETFNPDRWNHPLREPRAYIPFLTGPRQCIGRHLAELHFVVTIHTLLKRFSMQVLTKKPPILPYLIPRFAEAVPARIQLHHTHE